MTVTPSPARRRRWWPASGFRSSAAHLRSVPAANTWPAELRVLQAMVEPDDRSIGPALTRFNEWPGFNLNELPWRPDADLNDPIRALADEQARLSRVADDRHPERSLLRVDDHIAQLAMHCDDVFGFQQWFLFDDVWAGHHHDLAQSLLRYAANWDPGA